ncbi:MAG: DUF1983 domain-containing protein [Piscirickettsiaceae bacterium]|nr:DUF1983 domain-containing protein [Piscirickettsiaceae bacterium]
MSESNLLVTVINNPFDPMDCVRSTPEWSEGIPAGSLVPVLLMSFVLSVNGKIIPEEDMFDVILEKGDSVVVCPVPQGGKSKNIFRMVALIAVAVFAPQLAAMLPGAGISLGIGTLTLGSLYTVGISMVGNMLVNALLPPSSAIPSKSNYNEGLDESKTYGIDGAKNTSSEDIAVPLVYGRHRIGGNRIGAYVENVGDTQILYMLFNAGEGVIAGISDIKLNNQDISTFSGVETKFRSGSATQSPIGWFDDSIVPVSRNLNLTTTPSLYTTSKEVDKIRIDIIAPNGLALYNDEGGTDARTVGLEIRYRKVGDATWIDMVDTSNVVSDTITYYYSDTDVEQGSLRAGTSLSEDLIVDDYIGTIVGSVVRQPVYSTVTKITGKGRAAKRKSFLSPLLPEGFYEVSVRRPIAEDEDVKIVENVSWGEINEIVTDDVAYRHTALQAIKVTLSDQLTSVPNVTFLHGGKYVKVRRIVGNVVVWSIEASSNPAWVAYDIITNTRYGGRISESRIDINQWQDWADFCESSDLRFDGVFDTQSNVWDSIQYVFRAGHAQIVNVGTRYTVAIERADTPVMMFNSSNIVEKSLNVTWLPQSERSNEIEVTYWNKDAGYARQIMKVRDPSVGPNEPVRTARITLFGITRSSQAIKEAIFHLNLNKHITQTVEFEASIEAIACTVGSQILIQHELPNWSEGGRAEIGSTVSVIKLDREVTISAGISYKILAAFDSVQRFASTVSGVVSNIAWLTGYDGSTNSKRVIINGIDYRIARFVNDGIGGFGVELDDASAVISGHSYVLYDTDVIEERNVTTGVGTHTEVTVDAVMPAALPQFAKWMLGDVTKVKKPFRVLAVSGSNEYTRSIKAIEYKDEVYDLTNTVVNPVIESRVSISHVRNPIVDETWLKSGSTYSPVADLGWELPLTGMYGGADIYAAKNGGEYERVGNVGSQELQFSYTSLSVGDTVNFKIIARDIINQKASFVSAVILSHTATARPETGTPTTLNVTTVESSYVLSWVNPTETFSQIEIWRSTTDDVLTASQINAVTGITYTDTSAPMGVPVFYWVRTINADGLNGDWNAAGGSTAPVPGQVSGLVIVGAFSGSSVTIKWNALAEASDYIVEIKANAVLSRAVSVRGTEYTYSISDAVNDNNINRAITLTVKPRLINSSVGADVSVIATNSQIATAPANVTLSTNGDQISVNFDRKTEGDLAGYKIWASETPEFTPSALNLIYSGPNPGHTFTVAPDEDWNVVTGAYDVWGEDGMTLSGESAITATNSGVIASQLTDSITRSHLAAVLEGEIDALENEWTVKVETRSSDGQPYIAGMGISVDQGTGNSGATTSQIIMKADTFSIIPSDVAGLEAATAPFIVSGGQVFMSQAFIEDASITNAKIGNIIQSTTFSPTQGWKIDKAGTAQFSSITIRDGAGNIVLSSGGTYADAISNGAQQWSEVSGAGIPADNADVTTDNLAGSGVNIVSAEYAVLESTLPTLGSVSATGTPTVDAVVAYFGSQSLKIAATGADAYVYLGANSTDYNIKMSPNKKWIVSAMVRASAISKDGELYVRTADSGVHYSLSFTSPAISDTWVRVFGTVDLTSDDSTSMIMRVDNDGGVGVDMFFDGLMIEEQIGSLNNPSSYALPAGVGGGGVGAYDELTGLPTSIADINTTEGDKLGTIAENADVTGSNVAAGITGQTAFATLDQITSVNISTYIAGVAIQTAHIANAAITNAKIGDVIQSAAYSAGTAGWKLDKNGNMELNSAVFRGTIDVKSGSSGARLEIKNNVIKVFDSSGLLRVKMGDLAA